jgi:hypothetical protein
MEFLALIHADEAEWESMGENERQALYQRYMDFDRREGVVGGSQLQSTGSATTVQVRNGDRLVTDGPYAEVKEALGGYYILDANSIDDACKLAAGIPAAERGAVEVRPVYLREES